MIKSVDLSKQYNLIGMEIDAAIKKIVRSGIFIGGLEVEKFEKDFGKYTRAKYCLGVGNGTDALEIAIESLNFPSGSEIILPANTFIATAESIVRSGHRPVFADVENNDYNLSILDLSKKINRKTVAIIVVHLFGQPCKMDEVKKLAGKKIKIIEDCSQAHGAIYKNKRVGSIGDVGTFSFFPAKNLGAYGDAGAIVTKQKTTYEKCRLIANHGRVNKFNHKIVGRNSRMDALQAAILSVKLRNLDQWNNCRRKNAAIYLRNLSNIHNLVLPEFNKNTSHVYHQFVIQHKNRNKLQEFLFENGVETGIHYPRIITDQLAFRKYSKEGDTPTAKVLADEILSLPVAEHLTTADIYYIIETIKQFK